ncbi:hypothetical protein CAAN1_19S00122 [[Candida] anglica]|uniref:Uncharacterized protein n=1 Tax=[Candida] anglica TaxID=148631 RepID=A0ABP0E534_9ASCO
MGILHSCFFVRTVTSYKPIPQLPSMSENKTDYTIPIAELDIYQKYSTNPERSGISEVTLSSESPLQMPDSSIFNCDETFQLGISNNNSSNIDFNIPSTIIGSYSTFESESLNIAPESKFSKRVRPVLMTIGFSKFDIFKREKESSKNGSKFAPMIYTSEKIIGDELSIVTMENLQKSIKTSIIPEVKKEYSFLPHQKDIWENPNLCNQNYPFNTNSLFRRNLKDKFSRALQSPWRKHTNQSIRIPTTQMLSVPIVEYENKECYSFIGEFPDVTLRSQNEVAHTKANFKSDASLILYDQFEPLQKGEKNKDLRRRTSIPRRTSVLRRGRSINSKSILKNRVNVHAEHERTRALEGDEINVEDFIDDLQYRERIRCEESIQYPTFRQGQVYRYLKDAY